MITFEYIISVLYSTVMKNDLTQNTKYAGHIYKLFDFLEQAPNDYDCKEWHKV